MTTADRLAKRRRLAHMRRESAVRKLNTCPNCGAVTYNTGLCVPCLEVEEVLHAYPVAAQFAPETAFNPTVRSL